MTRPGRAPATAQPILRLATPRDAAPCAAILGDWIAATSWFPRRHPATADRPFMAGKIATEDVTVALCGWDLTGFIARDGAYISCLYVASRWQGQGIGRRLLDVAKSATPDLSLWTFQANSGAQRFYLREGFTEAQRTDGMGNEEHLPDIEYVWTREATA